MAAEKGITKKKQVTGYLQSSIEELRKVTWPTKNQAVKMTFLVLGFCFMTAVMIGVLDFVFGIGYRALLDLGPERSLPASVQTEADASSNPITSGAVTVTDENGNEVNVDVGTESASTTGVPEVNVDVGATAGEAGAGSTSTADTSPEVADSTASAPAAGEGAAPTP